MKADGKSCALLVIVISYLTPWFDDLVYHSVYDVQIKYLFDRFF